MKKINAIILLSSLTSASVFAGAYVENREAYNLASDQGEVMLIEGWYPLFKPTDKLTIQPGGLINDKSISSGGAVYLDVGNDSNLLIVFYVQIMPDDLVMQLHRF
ncbi:Oligogalacturonate-specific porin protein KdgM [Shigella flexneri]|uniref:Oligogalacturonate-specific porin protein KdgM n=1 Tax=Shigella flexneri TaxID=623 RepID=A0A658Z178_SHIFL|nr:Oligogalacturonate-specific porin protein KdgM [Shigella flexneri]